jgi:plasmid stabilization system protein ParE
VVDAIFNCASLLAQQPHLGRAGKRARSLGVGAYPYIIRYRIRRDEVEILSIWHDRQKRPR